MLQQQLAEHTAALNTIDDDLDQMSVTHSRGGYGALGYRLEDLEHPGVVHRITRATITVGRSKTNDIAVDSTSVSRYHARLLIKPAGLRLVDLQSTNGCSINGSRVSQQMLSDGDAVLIGRCRYRFAATVVTEKAIESRLTELQDADAAWCASLAAFDADPESRHR